MGRVPVAKPKLLPRGWPSPRRGFLLGLLMLGVVAVGGVGLASIWPETAPPMTQPHWVRVADADDLYELTPLRVIEQRLWLVKLESGEVLALRAVSTSAVQPCTLPFNESYEFMGNRGWFRSPCGLDTYDVTGACYAGPCARNLDRYEVRLNHGGVEVFVGGRNNSLIRGGAPDLSIPPVNSQGTSSPLHFGLGGLSPGSPKYFGDGNLFLVELKNGEILALSARSPHLGCQLEWRTYYVREEGTNWFYDPCHGSVFDIEGVWQRGPASRGMERFPVALDGDTAIVTVDLRLCQPRFKGFRVEPYTEVGWSHEACDLVPTINGVPTTPAPER